MGMAAQLLLNLAPEGQMTTGKAVQEGEQKTKILT